MISLEYKLKNKKHYKIVFSSVASILVFSAILYSAFLYTNQKKEIAGKVLIVESTDETQDIISKLQTEGLIKNRFTYYTLKALLAFSGDVKPGGYDFSHGLSALALHEAITNPKFKYVSIEPGLRKEQIIEKISEKIDVDQEHLRKLKGNFPLCSYTAQEGYLAPGEYLVADDATIQDFQQTMRERFESNYVELEKRYAGKKFEDLFSKDQIVTIASLIQREAAGKNDMRLISGIIWNRLIEGMPLQIDATLQYVKGEDGKWWPVPKSEDKFIESEYNTYQNEGLPPGPISNPSKDAIAAAMSPLQTSCLFYLHDRSRNIHCSSNYKGHLANIKRYLK